MNIVPINNCILVELSSHHTSANGLELPVKEEDKSLRSGKVLAISENIKGIDVGDTVIFGEYAYDSLLFDGQYHIFLDFDDIVAKIK